MEYVTVEREGTASFVERKSEFIGSVCPVTTEQEALDFLAKVRKQYPDARHHVYAYRLRDNNIQRFSDDGEPQGTGGKPVLSVLEKQGITDCIVVVTRYFGGILLGTGGLVRAYGHGASIGVKEAHPIRMVMCRELSIRCDYAQYGKLQGVVIENGGFIDDTLFTDDVELIVTLPLEKVEPLQAVLTDVSCGTVQAEKRRDKWQRFDAYFTEE